MPLGLPDKLKTDAIAEALLEIRFNSSEISEVVVGRLNDVDLWKDFKSSRLAVSQLPESIREHDETVKYQAIIERRNSDGNLAIRIGAHVLSIHFNKPYPGWEGFHSKIEQALGELFQKIPNLVVNRLGLRYINFIESGSHSIKKFDDLALDINLKSGQLKDNVNLAYVEQPDAETIVQTRVASPNFIGGPNIPHDTTAAIDVDVYTPTDFVSKDLEQVLGWVAKAHDIEKGYFFGLLPDDVIEKLRSK